MNKRVTVHVAHAEFLPERKETLARLMGQLEDQCRPVVHRSTQREHASVWATRVYAACAAEDADAAIVLNDDVEVSGDLVGAVAAMLDAATSRMISLHPVHPMGRSLAEAGLRWFATYHLTGPGYVLRKGVAKELLAYYRETPKHWNTKNNEDNVAIQLAFRHREPIWNAMPALLVHDTTVPSSLGYDNHPSRVTTVPWTDAMFKKLDLRSWETWDPGKAEVPFLETHWTDHRTLVAHELCNDLGIPPEWCWWCLERPASFGSPKSGARMCPKCLHDTVGGVINTAMKGAAR